MKTLKGGRGGGGRGRGGGGGVEVWADEDVSFVVFCLGEFFEEPSADDLEVRPEVVASDDGEEVVFDYMSTLRQYTFILYTFIKIYISLYIFLYILYLYLYLYLDTCCEGGW